MFDEASSSNRAPEWFKTLKITFHHLNEQHSTDPMRDIARHDQHRGLNIEKSKVTCFYECIKLKPARLKFAYHAQTM